MNKVRVAIAGVGNCASSLVQGVQFYAGADPAERVPGLMHVELGGYHVGDVEFVAASGRTQALVTLQPSDLRSVSDDDLLAVRRVEQPRDQH